MLSNLFVDLGKVLEFFLNGIFSILCWLDLFFPRSQYRISFERKLNNVVKKNKLGREHPLSYTTEEWIFAVGVCS